KVAPAKVAVPEKKVAPPKAVKAAPTKVVSRGGPAGMSPEQRSDYDALPDALSRRRYTMLRKNSNVTHEEALARLRQAEEARTAVARVKAEPAKEAVKKAVPEAAPSAERPAVKRTARGAATPTELDPLEVYADSGEDEGALRQALDALEPDALRAIIRA